MGQSNPLHRNDLCDAARHLRRAIARIEGLEPRQLLAAVAPTLVNLAGDLVASNFYLPTHTLYTAGTTLTSASKQDMGTIAINVLKARAADLGLTAADVASPIITDRYSDDDTGITHVYLRQSLNGLPIQNADMVVNLMPDGSVISVAGGFVAHVAKYASKEVAPQTAASAALTVAAQQLSLAKGAPRFRVTSTSKKLTRLTLLDAPTVSQDPVSAHLDYVPTADGLQLAWNFALRTTDDQHWYNVAVSDKQNQIVFADDWTDRASYNSIVRPNESPQDGGFTVTTDPQDPTASPFGWHDANGVAGPEFTDTRGNNVDAHLDRNNDDAADGTRPDGGASLNFSGLTFDPTSAPTTAQNQAIAQENLFYEVNTAHDLHYKYGFNEAAGNFQTNDYGRGGVGGDAVQADAQDGGGTNNANFATPPDGSAGRMQMYLFTSTNPQRDGDLDSSIIFHEFGHGVSTRLTGGPANSDSLDALQSGGMGEGWSDFWALTFLQRATDTQNAPTPVASYVLGQNGTGNGIRRFPYSFDMAIDPLTSDAFGASGTGGGVTRSLEVHNTGEIWTSTLWDMNWLLINKYGFESNLLNGFNPAAPKGNSLALQLVADALKIQPANPSLKDARDALLQADANLHATTGLPSNAAEIWAAFARRGMGTGFIDNSATADSLTPSFTVPVADPTVTSTLPATTISPFSSVDIRFDQPMNTTSFSVASDVLSFTGPHSTNLLASISGFSWTDSQTLHIALSSTQTIRGTYTLVIGPNILAADDNHAMDTDRDGTPGEPVQDQYNATIVLSDSIGPDAFGYKTVAYPFENINLVAGAAGVTTLVNGSDDGSNAINIGTNTFNYYGTTYSATSIFASANGLITMGVSNTSFSNDALISSGSARIAPFWADWRTDVNGTGGGDSSVLYTVDTANNRLIIEWNDVASYYGSGVATFQAILQLNTGATPGRILFNYPDVDINGAGSFAGIGTVGIKAVGTQGVNRLLLTDDFVHPWVNNGLAVETAIDTTAPQVSSETFNYLTNQSITMSFTEDVGATLAASDFTLTNTTTSTVVNSANLILAYNAVTKTATLTNTGPILADGNYVLTINSSGVTDASGNFLDGDADGVIGGNNNFSFFVLAGDANHNRHVDFDDLLTLSQNYGQSGKDFSQGNFDYSADGMVDFSDLLILAQHYGTSLAVQAELPKPTALAKKRDNGASDILA